MITKTELKSRVERRKCELESQREEAVIFRDRIKSLIEDIRSRSVIYNLVKNLTVWKEIEKLISLDDHTT